MLEGSGALRSLARGKVGSHDGCKTALFSKNDKWGQLTHFVWRIEVWVVMPLRGKLCR